MLSQAPYSIIQSNLYLHFIFKIKAVIAHQLTHFFLHNNLHLQLFHLHKIKNFMNLKIIHNFLSYFHRLNSIIIAYLFDIIKMDSLYILIFILLIDFLVIT